MKLLRDTHIQIAAIGRRLHSQHPKTARLLDRDDSQPHASGASLREIALETRLGKLNPGMSSDLLPQAVQASGIGIVPIRQAHALVTVEPVLPTGDPVDRMRLAQCQVEDCLLVTVDGAPRDHPLAMRI